MDGLPANHSAPAWPGMTGMWDALPPGATEGPGLAALPATVIARLCPVGRATKGVREVFVIAYELGAHKKSGGWLGGKLGPRCPYTQPPAAPGQCPLPSSHTRAPADTWPAPTPQPSQPWIQPLGHSAEAEDAHQSPGARTRACTHEYTDADTQAQLHGRSTSTLAGLPHLPSVRRGHEGHGEDARGR